MITFFNKIGNSWLAKFICALLGISMMAFWGLGGLSHTFSGGDHKAITIDSDIITVDQINQKLNQERSKVSALTGQNLSVTKAIELGLLERVIQQTISEKLSEKIADEIGLSASDESVRKYVERNPLFQNALGQFDSNLFYAYMGQLKLNQAELSSQLKKELMQQHLLRALSKVAPNKIIEAIAHNQKEKREITGIFLSTKDINVGMPDANTLRDYYEAYSEEFMAPEYRQVQLLSILPSHFKGEKEQAYDKMYQVVQNLEDLLGEGIPLKQAAQRLNLHTPSTLITDINGKNSAATLADKRLENNPILQELFTLSEGEATSITDYENGFLVAEVEKIVPSALKPYEVVENQVKTLWKTEQQKEKLPQLIQKMTTQIVDSNDWGMYETTHEIVEQTQAKHIPLELLPSIFSQKIGYKNARNYPVQDGTWIIVVNRAIRNTHSLSKQEKEAAEKLYAQDLFNITQKAYAKNWDVKVNESAIKKFFSSYSKEEEE